jgi:hypothetical protein
MISTANTLSLPSLTGVPQKCAALADDMAAAEVARTVLLAGIGSPADWSRVNRSPTEFLRVSIDAWLDRHGEPSLRRNFFLDVTLSGRVDPNSFYGDDSAGDVPRRLYLSVQAEAAGYVVLGPTLRLLGKTHKRLPSSFFHAFLGAVNRWVRVYDYRDAQDRVEYAKEWLDQDEESESQYELPAVEQAIPTFMSEKPFGGRTLLRIRDGLRNRRLRRILDAVCELDTGRFGQRDFPVDEAAREEMSDSNPPVPALLAVFEKHDAIEACFDEEAQTMLECPPEPNAILPFDGTNVSSVKRAFEGLADMTKTLARASDLIDMLPGNEREEAEDEDDG